MISNKETKNLNTNSGVSIYNINLNMVKNLRSTAVEMYQIQDPNLDVCVLPYGQLHTDSPSS